MVFINETGFMASALNASANDFTGNIFLSLLVIWIVFFFIGTLFKIEFIYIAIILIPITLTLMAYFNEWKLLGGCVLLLIAMYMAKNWVVSER